jgi:hypothetical protein
MYPCPLEGETLLKKSQKRATKNALFILVRFCDPECFFALRKAFTLASHAFLLSLLFKWTRKKTWLVA